MTTFVPSRSPRQSPRTAHQVLDPCTLGRPVHLLQGFTAQWKVDLADHLQRELNRRYRCSFEAGLVTLERAGSHDLANTRWVTLGDDIGRVAFAIERRLLLSMLGFRYSDTQLQQASLNDAVIPETATEERLAQTLGQRLVTLLGARIDATGQDDTHVPAPRTFRAAPVMRSAQGVWMLRAVVREQSLGVEGLLWFALDAAWMDRLFRQIAPLREKTNEHVLGKDPLPKRLQLELVGRLVQKEMTLGELFDMRPGDVIPIRLGDTDVLIDDSCLFTAAVAEHKGKLCLTTFEPVE